MDAHRFDRLTRGLVQRLPRRRGLGLLLGAVSAALVAHLRAEETVAKCVRLGKKCDKKNKKKDKCCGGGKCKGKRCKCTNGRVECAKSCCNSGQICVDGECISGQGICPDGADTCAGDRLACNVTSTCFCFRTTEGATRCGQPRPPETVCGNCTSSAQCAAAFPGSPGVFCALDSFGLGDACGCTAGDGSCVPLCPDL